MALASYSDLKTTIANYLARSDLTSVIPDFITLSEAKLKRKFTDLTSLSDSNTSNWMLQNHPDVYLYGALLEAQPYLMDDARIPVWAQIFERVVSEVRRPSTSANFTNYAGLKAMVADWLDRPDLTNIIPTLISMGEYRLQRDLRTRQMLIVATASTTGGDSTVGLPTDFLEMRDIHIKTTPISTLHYLSPSAFYAGSRTTESGRPVDYTLLGAEIQLSPIPDTAYTLQMLYFAKPTLLSDSNSSNVFLANYPDALLYATLGEAAPYLANDARLQTWAALYDRAIAAINTSDQSSEFGGQPMSMSYNVR